MAAKRRFGGCCCTTPAWCIQVLGCNSHPVVGASVSLTWTGGGSASGTTGSDGKFCWTGRGSTTTYSYTITPPAGSHLAAVSSSGSLPAIGGLLTKTLAPATGYVCCAAATGSPEPGVAPGTFTTWTITDGKGNTIALTPSGSNYLGCQLYTISTGDSTGWTERLYDGAACAITDGPGTIPVNFVWTPPDPANLTNCGASLILNMPRTYGIIFAESRKPMVNKFGCPFTFAPTGCTYPPGSSGDGNASAFASVLIGDPAVLVLTAGQIDSDRWFDFLAPLTITGSP